MKIAIVGTGYVGLVAGAALASLGHSVACIDRDIEKIELLKEGKAPFYEPDLADLISAGISKGTLAFDTAIPAGVAEAQVAIVAVGTPTSAESDEADLGAVFSTVAELVQVSRQPLVVVIKSTVPLGTLEKLEALRDQVNPGSEVEFASNPEFLRQGSAVKDFLHPNRIVIGVKSAAAEKLLRQVYEAHTTAGHPLVVTTPASAELIKYAANCYLAMRLAYFNQISDLCELAGASYRDVSQAVGLDDRIGPHFMKPGPGFGGSCFPKDTLEMAQLTRKHNLPASLIETTIRDNRGRKERLVDRVERALNGTLAGKKVAVLGLSFKADTDDLRESAALVLIPALLARGAKVSVHDPKAMPGAKKILEGVAWADAPLQACKGVDATVIVTEWKQFAAISPQQFREAMRGKAIVDFRNLFVPRTMHEAGLEYHTLGEPSV